MKKIDSQATQHPTSSVGEAKYIGAIAKSLAVLALRMAPNRLKEKSDQVPFLDAIGLDRNEIAGLLGMTPESVSTTLSQNKAKTEKGKKGRGKNKR